MAEKAWTLYLDVTVRIIAMIDNKQGQLLQLRQRRVVHRPPFGMVQDDDISMAVQSYDIQDISAMAKEGGANESEGKFEESVCDL